MREWVLVSPHRTQRPWQGAEEAGAPAVPSYDPDCYLCPGNARVGGVQNPNYDGPMVFANDFPALLSHSEGDVTSSELFRAENVTGTCEVICYGPDHGRHLAQFTATEMRAVIDLWAATTARLGATYPWVQIFENRGAAMGASNPHPHGQVWACDWLPEIPAREDAALRDYHQQHQRPLLQDVVDAELAEDERVVAASEEWVWWVPYWAVWPFETLLAPCRPAARLTDLDEAQLADLAEFLPACIRRYDALFGVPFPYSMGWHGAPFGAASEPWTVHAHFFPPLLRSASVRKWMVGFELLAMPQRDLTAEQAAQRLRETRP